MATVDFRTNPPLESFILLDTSILLAGLHPVALPGGAVNHQLYPAHADVRAFLYYVTPEVLAGNTILVVTDLAIEEAAHHISMKLLRQEITSGKHSGYALPQEWNALYKRRPRVIESCIPTIARFVAAVQAIPITILAPSDLLNIQPALSDLMVKNMQRYQLLAADGYHLAVAEAMGISSVATLDGDWLRAGTDFTILINR